jgi:hypothetical protein
MVAGALLDQGVLKDIQRCDSLFEYRETYLCLLLGSSTCLGCREWSRSGFLSGCFGRLSLRKEDISDCSTIAVFFEL